MVAPLVADVIVTGCAELYVPAPGLNVGVATVLLMTYAALATLLLARPLSVPMASRVSEALTVTVPPFASVVPVEQVPGVVAPGAVPFVV